MLPFRCNSVTQMGTDGLFVVFFFCRVLVVCCWFILWGWFFRDLSPSLCDLRFFNKNLFCQMTVMNGMCRGCLETNVGCGEVRHFVYLEKGGHIMGFFLSRDTSWRFCLQTKFLYVFYLFVSTERNPMMWHITISLLSMFVTRCEVEIFFTQNM